MKYVEHSMPNQMSYLAQVCCIIVLYSRGHFSREEIAFGSNFKGWLYNLFFNCLLLLHNL